jgi:hypothetical protein
MTWVDDDPIFAATYRAAVAEFQDGLVTEFISKARKGVEKTADAISWMFLLKQADPSFRDNAKVVVEASQALTDILKDLQTRVKRAQPRVKPDTSQIQE